MRVNTNSSVGVIGRGHYPFGEEWDFAASLTKWKFTDYENDSESGLNHVILRFDSTRLAASCSAIRLRLSGERS